MGVRFHAVYDKLNQALDDLPYNDLGISDEVKEQVNFFFLSQVDLLFAARSAKKKFGFFFTMHCFRVWEIHVLIILVVDFRLN